MNLSNQFANGFRIFSIAVAIGALPACDSNELRTGSVTVLTGESEPAWSPDGRWIAYNFTPDIRETSTSGLYLLDLESGDQRLVAAGYARTPDWRPDGERIAFHSRDIFTIRPDGTDRQRITVHGHAFFPRWSPDGGSISYGRSGTHEEVGIWFYHFDDNKYQRWGFGSAPDWHPDGRTLIYTWSGNSSGGAQLWTADTSGVDRVQLSNNSFAGNRHPSWSPDGSRIAWTALYPGGSYGLWVMNADGSEQHELLRLERRGDFETGDPIPSWAPDCEKLVFSWPTPSFERLVLWTISRDGTGLRQLTP